MRASTGSLRVLLLVMLALPAAAGEGVIELNQACVLNGGCVLGDVAGFPIRITTPGSYRLTSNLSQELELLEFATSGISVQADDVSIDLNGFAITCQAQFLEGVGRCTNGSASGISRGSSSSRTRVRNGIVRGFPTDGVGLGSTCIVEGLIAEDNGVDGIRVSANSIVRGSIANGNGGDGIDAGPRSLVENNVSTFNAGFGLDLYSDSGYRGNLLSGNTMGDVQAGNNLGGSGCGTVACP